MKGDLSFSTLIVCCVIFVSGKEHIFNSDDDSEKSIPADDTILPQIQILVKSYPKVAGKHEQGNTQIQSNVEQDNNMVNDQKTEISDISTDISAEELDSNVTADQGIQNGSDNSNSFSTDELISDSFLTSVQEISSIATSAWNYITQARDTTEFPDKKQEVPSLEFTEQTEGTYIESTELVGSDNTRTSTKPGTFTYVHSEKHDLVSSENVVEDAYTTTSQEELLKTNGNDKHSNEDTKNYVEKDNTQLPAHKTRNKIRENKIYRNTKNSLLKPFSISNKKGTNLNSRPWRSRGSLQGGKILSGNKKELLNSVHDKEIRKTDKKNNDYISDNSVAGNDNIDLVQANEPWYQLSWFVWDSATDEPSPQKQLGDGQKPEDNVADTEIGSATSSVSATSVLPDDEENLEAAEGPVLDYAPIYRPGISYNSFRPTAEADLRTSDVTKLINHYETCDTCMIAIYNTSHECPFYGHQVDEFEKWARQFSDLLKYGCSGQGVQHRERCCHTPDATVQTAVQEIHKLIKSMDHVLLKQCEKCPADCVWSEWGSWSDCPVTCDTPGFRNRSRSQIGEKCGGKQCLGQSTEREVCPLLETEYGTWLSWSSWSSCSGTCGGTRHRTRKCSEPTKCSCFVACDSNKNVEVESCGDQRECCHPRIWASWGSWTACVTTEDRPGRRQKTRWRSCEAEETYIDQPMCPQPCPGPERENAACCTLSTWSEWSEWSACVVTVTQVDLETGKQCGNGCKHRTRECLPGTCQNDSCYGDHIERISCQLDPCCESPTWTEWSLWSACSATAGSGFRRRHRTCQAAQDKWRSPTCRAGGCYGQENAEENEQCQGVCPNCVPPKWGSWESWSECHSFQNRQRRISRRRCLNISWDTNCRHLQCEGSDTVREEECICDAPAWTPWSQWGPCDADRVPPQRMRYRVCIPATNPPYCKEVACIGPSEQNERCCRQQEWMSWEAWSACDFRSDQPRRTRTRTCSPPEPGCLDTSCAGNYIETMICQPYKLTTPPPCDPGKWGTWGSWSSCDCRSTRRRFRARHKTPTYPYIIRPYVCPPLTESAYESCEDECEECTETCEGRKDGKYPSCKRGCRSYITCCTEQIIAEDCKGDQQYDSLCQECRRPPSPTCSAGQYDRHRDSLVIPVKSKEECRDL